MSRPPSLYSRIRTILESARTRISRTINTTQVIANWLIGREIVEEEQQGKRRATYGKKEIEALSTKLQAKFGVGYSVQNLSYMRQFYQTYPDLLAASPILHAPRGKSLITAARFQDEISRAMRGESAKVSGKTVNPGELNPDLSWTHYRTLLRVVKHEARAFYEIETIKNNWSARELERQINSLLYERIALSKDKKGLMDLATKGQEVHKPADAIKDPLVMEFLGIPSAHQLVETQLEQALISNLQSFLLELGRGFAFVSRQERITLDGDHPTIGLILCTDKNDAVVQYTIGKDQDERLRDNQNMNNKGFEPKFTTINRITTGLTLIERARGFLEAATLSENWIREMGNRALLLEAHHTTHIEGTRLTLEEVVRS